MALSTRKKNIIRAEYRAGKYANPSQAAKAHGIDRKTAVKILEGVTPENAALVEAAVIVESTKNSLKNPVDRAAVEAEVKSRLSDEELRAKVDDATLKVLEGVSKLLEKGTKSIVVKDSYGPGVVVNREMESDLTPGDYKDVQDTVDKASLTLGVNQRHASQQLNVNTQNNQINETNVHEISAAIADGLPD